MNMQKKQRTSQDIPYELRLSNIAVGVGLKVFGHLVTSHTVGIESLLKERDGYQGPYWTDGIIRANQSQISENLELPNESTLKWESVVPDVGAGIRTSLA